MGFNGTRNILSQHMTVLEEDLLDGESHLLDLSHPSLILQEVLRRMCCPPPLRHPCPVGTGVDM